MTRADALKALDEAFADRLKLEYNNLANGFMGNRDDRQRAAGAFANGVIIHQDAYEFAVDIINQKFKE